MRKTPCPMLLTTPGIISGKQNFERLFSSIGFLTCRTPQNVGYHSRHCLHELNLSLVDTKTPYWIPSCWKFKVRNIGAAELS